MRILMIGCGAIGKATLLYWKTVIPHITYDELYIIEPEPLPRVIKEMTTKHLQLEVTPSNYQELLEDVNPNFVIDLSVYVFSISILTWCTMRNVPYISTALEEWEDAHEWAPDRDTYLSSLLYMQRTCLQLNQQPGYHPTVLIDHGMNPGLISHFTKAGIKLLARQENVRFTTYAKTAKKLGIQAVICSEVDTQRTIYDANPDPSVFYNTWSSIGYFEESTLCTQIGWGSHEKPLSVPYDRDVEQVFLRQMGVNTRVRGYNPLVGEYIGLCIPHGEAASIPRFLTYGDYRPSSYYVYKSSYVSERSLENLRKNNYEMLPKYLLVNSQEVISGADAVGALFIREDQSLMWCGTIIQKEDVPEEFREWVNPTCVQVACGVLSGIDYVLRNPNKGVIFPEDVDTERVMELVEPFLGKVIYEKMPGKLPSDFASLMLK